MDNQPLVTLIVPAYNHEAFVKQSLQSVYEQNYRNIELLIINDGSTDQTDQKIKEWMESCPPRFIRIEYRYRKNKGLSASLNEGLKWASGEYFTFVASDDILYPNKITSLVNDLEIKSEQFAVSFGDANFIDNDGAWIQMEHINTEDQSVFATSSFLTYYTYHRDFDFQQPEAFGTYQTLLLGNYLPAMSCLIRTHAVQEAGGWSENIALEDWDLWLKLSKNYHFSYVHEIVASYRWHESNTVKVRRNRLILDSIYLLEREREYALNNKLEKQFFPMYLFYLRLLKDFNSKLYTIKMAKLATNTKFIMYAIRKIVKKINAS